MASADDDFFQSLIRKSKSPAEPALLDQTVPGAPDAAPSKDDEYFQGLLKKGKAPASNVDTWDDVKKSVVPGLTKGVAGLIGLPGNLREMVRAGGDWAQRKLGFEPAPQLEDISQSAKKFDPRQPTSTEVEKRLVDNVTGPLYEPKTVAGQYTRTAAEFAPAMLIGGGGTGITQRVIGNAAAPAIGNETFGQLAKKYAPSWEGAARTAGSFAGSFAIPTARAVVTPMPTRPTYQRHVDRLTQEGIPLSAGERTGNQAMRYMEDATKTIPMGGRRIENQAMERDIAFTRAALRRAGINAAEATEDTLGPAYTAMGNEFRRFETNFPIWAGSPNARQLEQDVQRVLQRYQSATSPTTRVQGVQESADDIVAAIQQANPNVASSLGGERLSNLRNALRERAEGQDFATQRAFGGLREALHDAMERAMARASATGNPADVDRWRALRREYNNFLVIEQAATRGNAKAAEGLIEPAALENAVKAVGGVRNHALGRGNVSDLGRLGKAGRVAFTALPNSGTAQRGAALIGINAIGSAGGAALGHTFAGAPGAAVGALGGAAVPAFGAAAFSRFITNPLTQNILANQLWVNSPVNGARSFGSSAPMSLLGYADGGTVADMRYRMLEAMQRHRRPQPDARGQDLLDRRPYTHVPPGSVRPEEHLDQRPAPYTPMQNPQELLQPLRGYADGGAIPEPDYQTEVIERALRSATAPELPETPAETMTRMRSTHWEKQTRDKNGRWV